ncbi:MAG: hypothetical protein WC450_05275 [Candidatus Omnitrophota bacterium]
MTNKAIIKIQVERNKRVFIFPFDSGGGSVRSFVVSPRNNRCSSHRPGSFRLLGCPDSNRVGSLGSSVASLGVSSPRTYTVVAAANGSLRSTTRPNQTCLLDLQDLNLLS